MSPGQLKLHFASLCQLHGCGGVYALGIVHRVSPDRLRAGLVEYEQAYPDNLPAAEDALVRLAEAMTA